MNIVPPKKHYQFPRECFVEIQLQKQLKSNLHFFSTTVQY